MAGGKPALPPLSSSSRPGPRAHALSYGDTHWGSLPPPVERCGLRKRNPSGPHGEEAQGLEWVPAGAPETGRARPGGTDDGPASVPARGRGPRPGGPRTGPGADPPVPDPAALRDDPRPGLGSAPAADAGRRDRGGPGPSPRVSAHLCRAGRSGGDAPHLGTPPKSFGLRREPGLARLLGHSSPTVTMVYYHLLGSDVRPFVERMKVLRTGP
jgi:hypothetical protein